MQNYCFKSPPPSMIWTFPNKVKTFGRKIPPWKACQIAFCPHGQVSVSSSTPSNVLSGPHCSWDRKKSFNAIDAVQHFLASAHIQGDFWGNFSFNIKPPHTELSWPASRLGYPDLCLYLSLENASKWCLPFQLTLILLAPSWSSKYNF